MPQDCDASGAVTVAAGRVAGATGTRVSAESWLEWIQALKSRSRPLLGSDRRPTSGADGAEQRLQPGEQVGCTTYTQDPDDSIVQLNKILSPLQKVLKRHDFLGGSAPGYGDYIVFGAFQWAGVASKRQVIEHNCPVAHWFSRLLNAFNGFAASQPDRSYWD